MRQQLYVLTALFFTACGAYDSQSEANDAQESSGEVDFGMLDEELRHWPTGPLRAATFDGNGDYIDMPDAAETSPGNGDFTLGAWVDVPSVPEGSSYFIASQGVVALDYPGYALQIYNDGTPTEPGQATKLYFEAASSSHKVSLSVPSPSLGWHHIVGMRRGQALRLYIDGTLVSTSAPLPSPFNLALVNSFRIGASLNPQGGAIKFMSGAIDDVSIHMSALSDAGVASLMTLGANVTDPTLQGYWTFDNQTANDSSSAARHGTRFGNAGYGGGVSSFSETAARFDGNSSAVAYTGAETNFGTSDFTIACFIKLDVTVRPPQTIVSRGSYGPVPGYRLGFENARLTLDISNGSAPYQALAATSAIKGNRWHHVLATRRGNVLELYVDNALVGQTTTGASPLNVGTGAPFTVGGLLASDGSSVSQNFLGAIDNVVVLNRSVSAAEVPGLRRNGPNIGGPNLVKFIPFTHGLPADVSSFNRSGTTYGTRPSVVPGATFNRPEIDQLTSGYHVPTAMRMNTGGTTDFALRSGTVNMTAGISVVANVYLDSAPTGTQLIAGSGSVGPSDGVRLALLNSTLIFEVGNSVATRVFGGNLTPGRWHHVAGVKDGNTLKVYIDGVQTGTNGFGGGTVPVTNFRIGSDTQSNRFKGRIHNVALLSRALTATEVVDVGDMGPTSEDAAVNGYWPLQDGSVKDLGQSAVSTTTLSGSPKRAFGEVMRTRALAFTNTHYMSVGDTAFNFGTGPFTISGQFRVDSPASSTRKTLVSKGYADGSDGYRISIANSRVEAHIRAGGTEVVLPSTATVTSASAWYHFALTRGDSGLGGSPLFSLYLDGKYQGETLTAAQTGGNANINPTGALIVGATRGTSTTHPFSGEIDEVAVYSRRLLGQELRMEKDFGPNPEDAALLANYSFNYGAGLDVSPNERHGTITGGTTLKRGVKFHGHQYMLDLAKRSNNKGFVPLPNTGGLNATIDQTMSVEDVRNQQLDSTPPSATTHGAWPSTNPPNTCAVLTATNNSEYDDGFASAELAPYYADVPPFRMDHFDIVDDFAGVHLEPYHEYAALHGFNNVVPRGRGSFRSTSFMPAGTQTNNSKGLSIESFLLEHYPAGSLPRALNSTPLTTITSWLDVDYTPVATNEYGPFDYLMPDVEPDASDTWTDEDRRGFARYYQGLARAIDNYGAAIGVPVRSGGYPWGAASGIHPTDYFTLPSEGYTPAQLQNWNTYLETLVSALTTINPNAYSLGLGGSVYEMYMKSMNNQRVLNRRADLEAKPILPYVWVQYELKDAAGWSRGMVMREEDMGSGTFMMLFSGADGLVNWGHSGNDPCVSMHERLGLAIDRFFSAASAFDVTASGVTRTVRRYDPLYVRSYNPTTNDVTFQVGVRQPGGWGALVPQDALAPCDSLQDDANLLCQRRIRYAAEIQVDHISVTSPSFPVYTVKRNVFEALPTRTGSEMFKPTIEALALARWIEKALYFGVPAEWPSSSGSPIARLHYGPYHFVTAHNSLFEEHPDGATVKIALPAMASKAKGPVTFEADGKPRYYVVYPQP